jgi:signal transduction histidine kinase
LALKLQLHTLVQQGGLPPEALHSLRTVVEEMGLLIQRDIASLSRRLYPAIVRQGLVPGLQSLADRFDAVIDIALVFSDDLIAREGLNHRSLPEATRLTAYRIAEEALTNVVKHAQASRVVVKVGFEPEVRLKLAIVDNGLGFQTHEVSGGMGLAAMFDYAEAAGGTCLVESSPGRGTSIAVTLPLREQTPVS